MSRRILTAIHEPYVGLDNRERLTSEKGFASEADLVMPKTSGYGIKLDLDTPTYGWRDIHYQSTNIGTKQKAPDFWT